MSALAWPWLDERPLLLASGSAVRRTMLQAAGVRVEAVTSGVDERAVEAPLREEGASASSIAAALACAKALAVSLVQPDRVVLGADQTLMCGTLRFDKPETPEAAALQLRHLSGRPHSLHSAFVLARNGEILSEGADEATLTARELSDAFIQSYLRLPDAGVLDSVGCYRMEGPGALLFERIEGDHFTILGLPLLQTLTALRNLGLLAD